MIDTIKGRIGSNRGGVYVKKEDRRLVGLIQKLHMASDCSYGSPRITRDLRETGERCNKKRVARLIKQEGLRAKSWI
ncbi:MAG: transposase [Nitrospirae bacterium]|nr:transposase [Nitrospirota bacterium]